MKKYIAVIALIFVAELVYGQTIYHIGWEGTVGVGETEDLARGFGGRGATLLDVRSFVSDNISVGGSISWNVLYERESGTFREDNLVVSGIQKRYLNAVPIMATVHYYAGDYGEKTPYLGLGVGTMAAEQRVDMGLFSEQDNQWHFALAPEAGVLVPFGGKSSMIMKVKYNHAFGAGGIGPHQYLVFGVGFAWY